MTKASRETNSEITYRFLAQKSGKKDEEGAIFRFQVVGHKHRSKLPSDPVRKFLVLEREPENEHDPFAIRVLDGDVLIGYIAADETGPLHQIWDRIGTTFWLVNGPTLAAIFVLRKHLENE